MEKRSPHYLLSAIQEQMDGVETMNLTQSAQLGIRAAGMEILEALAVVRGLSRIDFYKSMTTNKDHRVWQDVYHGEWRGKPLYVKFQQAGEYFVVSFKEL
ncbi:MAG: type II toxin-antitoxin system MqsR family toxin [Sterolibacterium sp.]|jgi:motility quorum-sensing regulator/GCU-specific mRNA interferase toxin|nr:type II toxin-antitoxin system MqsR family toxin [Sterolibacterium sp.]